MAVELASGPAVAAALAERADGAAGEAWVAVGSGVAVEWPADLP